MEARLAAWGIGLVSLFYGLGSGAKCGRGEGAAFEVHLYALKCSFVLIEGCVVICLILSSEA
jgi:hypothetical protein